MFAVIKTGGKQYRVAANHLITVDKVAGAAGETIEFGEVLMVGGESPRVGKPTVPGATVSGEIVEQTRGDKLIAFKKRRRKNSRRKRGHRQELSVIRITGILLDGERVAGIESQSQAATEPQAATATESSPQQAEAAPSVSQPETAGEVPDSP